MTEPYERAWFQLSNVRVHFSVYAWKILVYWHFNREKTIILDDLNVCAPDGDRMPIYKILRKSINVTFYVANTNSK